MDCNPRAKDPRSLEERWGHMIMCRHVYTESIDKSYYDHNLQCRAEKRVRTCILCGKTEKETIYVKDPPKRKLPKFIKHDLSN